MKISVEIDVSVTLGGTPFPFTTLAEWSLIDGLVRAKLEPLHTSPLVPKELPDVISHADTAKSPDVDRQGQERERWAEKAWKEIGHPVTANEILRKMQQMGFKSRADNPLASIKAMIRGDKRFIRTGTNHNKATLWALRGYNFKPQNTTSAKKSVSDFAHEVLSQIGEPVDDSTLAELMVDAGWVTESPTPKTRANAVKAAVSRYPDKFKYLGGRKWALPEWSNDDSGMHLFDDKSTNNGEVDE
jgi:hypothetical protein